MELRATHCTDPGSSMLLLLLRCHGDRNNIGRLAGLDVKDWTAVLAKHRLVFFAGSIEKERERGRGDKRAKKNRANG